MLDDPGTRNGRRDVADTAHHRVLPDYRAQQFVLLYAVLERNDTGPQTDERQDCPGRRLGVPQFDAEHHQVDRADAGRIAGHFRRFNMNISRPTFHEQPVLAHGVQVGTPRNESDIASRARKLRTEISPYPAASHNCNAHLRPSLRCLDDSENVSFLIIYSIILASMLFGISHTDMT